MNECGGLIVDERIERAEMRASRYRYYIGGGSMHGLNQPSTQRLIEQGFNEFSLVSGVKFERTDSKSKARIKIEFRGNDSVMSNGKGQFALGKAWTSGRVALNIERKIPNLADRRIMQALIQHEVMHVFGWRHSPMEKRGCIMHPWLTSIFWCPKEIGELQRRWGTVPEFHPLDRVDAGKKIREAWSDHAEKVKRRTEIVKAGGWRPNHPLQAQILRLVDKIREHSMEWHEINNRWKGVKGVVQL